MERAKRSRGRLMITGAIVLALAAPIALIASTYLHEKRNVALIVAIHRCDSGDALALIHAGANPNAIDGGRKSITLSSEWQQVLDRIHGRHSLPSGPTALDLAVQANLSSVACALLDRGAAGANDQITMPGDAYMDEDYPLLGVAAIRRDRNLAAHLLSHGADVEGRTFLGTPLNVAASDGDLAMATLLLVHHADPNTCDGNGEPPLFAAIRAEPFNPGLVTYLIDHGANPNGLAAADYRDTSGDTPLHIAARHGRQDCAVLLLGRGAIVNMPNQIGGTPLMQASEAGRCAMVQFLLAHFATTSGHDRDGRTALIMAAGAGDADTIRTLIRAGSVINALDKIGETALDEAEDAESSDGAAVLRAAGARSGTSAGRIPAIARFLGLRLGYAHDHDINRSLHDWSMGTETHPNSRVWWINGASIVVEGFNDPDTGFTIDSLDAAYWHGKLRSAAPFRQRGFGPWGDLRVGMPMAEALSALRSKLPPPTVKSGALSWVAYIHGRRAGKNVMFTYTATLRFGNGLQGLHIDIAAPE